MNLPKVIADLVAAQNNFDSAAYTKCFSENAVVHDEGKTHNGRKEIEDWIADSNDRYQATIKPVGYEENATESILKAETSGNFPGSPIVLNYHLVIADGLIRSLKFTV
ncbi:MULTISPECIES: nuclear transport factor 2 family protein [Flavobacterium]|uniref:nuclear transport factor 2 family protein n=1 Tax=Flavobacterium TaxID=237 RepID=UPI0021152645|nr:MULTISPECIES: nuclear transport factor 2 family protein [Flavobacterium]UUF13103.1 nuclear transport factor 2 family protein [Flavobacterium panici]